MLRTDIINTLIQKFHYKTYLEIGVSNGWCFDRIVCDHKVGVDPHPQSPATFNIKSDEFFELNNQKFDIIFVDGLHHAEQVYKDVINSLDILEENGTIVCHDINPADYQAQYVPRQVKRWNGDCWRSWVRLRALGTLKMFCIDTDEGVGIITKGKSYKLEIKESELIYNNLVKNRSKWLGLIAVPEFKFWIKTSKND